MRVIKLTSGKVSSYRTVDDDFNEIPVYESGVVFDGTFDKEIIAAPGTILDHVKISNGLLVNNAPERERLRLAKIEVIKDDVRKLRSTRLSDMDNLINDAFLGSSVNSIKRELRDYKQALKDITDLVTDENFDIDAIVWPKSPTI